MRHGERRNALTANRRIERVEITGAGFALVAYRRIAARFGGEFRLLQLRIGRHAALPITGGEIEHAVIEAVEPGERDELKLVAHRPEVALEPRDRGFVEVGSPIEGRRAIVSKKLAREPAMDGFGENSGSPEIGPRRLPPQHVG